MKVVAVEVMSQSKANGGEEVEKGSACQNRRKKMPISTARPRCAHLFFQQLGLALALLSLASAARNILLRFMLHPLAQLLLVLELATALLLLGDPLRLLPFLLLLLDKAVGQLCSGVG